MTERLTDEVCDLLQAARDLLAKSGWCRGVNAKSERGKWASLASPRACKFCASGAIQRAGIERGASEETISEACQQLGIQASFQSIAVGLVDFNDTVARSKQDVLRLFDAVLDKKR